jgi:cell division transport system ATP-binding protein
MILDQPRREQRRRALAALDRVGLADRGDAFPRELSDGERQRVAIARALVSEPDVILADEPTGNLDPALAREILSLLEAANERGTTVVLATHDDSILSQVAGRILTLENGRLKSDGPWSVADQSDRRVVGV